MAIIKTDVGNTRENANRLRFEPTASIPDTNVQDAIERIAITPQALVPTPVAVGDSPYTVTDETYLEIDTSGGAITINMPAAAARLGVPLVLKDISGDAFTNNVTINPNGAEDIDELASISINVGFGGFRLNPKTGGYAVSP